jgi:glycerol-3-phosphate dehydrogenase (NAD(P)+)
MKIAVLGAGGWGTALARLLHLDGHSVTLWGHNPAHLLDLKTARENKRYLPGIALPESLFLEPDLSIASKDAEIILIALPSRAFREITCELPAVSPIIISATKGIERDTGLTMCGILEQNMPSSKAVAISGPTLALEVARGVPSAVVAASSSSSAADIAQQLLHRPAFRVYSSSDVIGVELGGALKNVVAIAAGVCDGLGFGDNAKAALLTRGLSEMRRLGVACGAQPETFSGLSGVGDLTVTCFSKLSRNRRFGERLGQGESVEQVLQTMEMVAEGVPTAYSASQLARNQQVATPIIDEVCSMLYEGKQAAQAMEDLINRQPKAED